MPGEVTRLLKEMGEGSGSAADDLVPLVYAELRRLAQHYVDMERPDHTLQATALVHEAYLRLVDQQQVTWQNKAHFIAVAAQIMRRVLVDHARAYQTNKRGGKEIRISLEEDALLFSPEQSEDLVALDEALKRLAEFSHRQSRVVELRYFGGLSVEETAEVLGISPKTVKREWSVAKAWLFRQIKEEVDGES